MADLGNLVVSLEANMVRFNSQMEDAARRTEAGADRMQAGLNAAKVAIIALGGVATVGLLAGLVQGAIEAADNLRDMSMKTGIAVETLNGLGFAAGLAGGSLESMVSAAGKLNKSIADAAGGGKETGAAFKALGIDVTDASGELKKADVVMAEVADQFAKYQDGPEKAALALAVFGKAGADMIPLLNEGGAALLENTEYAKKYSGMTNELANMSDEFNDTMAKLTLQQKSFGNILAEAVLPAINAVAAEMVGATEDGNGFTVAADAIRTVLETIIIVGSDVVFTFKTIGQLLGGVAAQAVALATLDMKGFDAISEAMGEDLAKATAEHEAFVKKVLAKPVKVKVDGTPDTVKPTAPRLAGAPAKAPRASGGAASKGKSEAEKALEDGARLAADLKRQEGALGLTGVSLLTYNMQMDGMNEKHIQAAAASKTAIEAWDEEEAAMKRRAAQQQRMTEQNAADVEQIRQSMLSDVDRENEFHQQTLDKLKFFHDTKLENVKQANAQIAAENARHRQMTADVQAAFDMQSVQMAGDVAGQLYALMQSAGAEQSALGKAAFAASKALAVAEIIMQAHVAAAKTEGQLGMFGIPMATMILVRGYASAAIVAGQAIASAEGGYDIPAGTNPVTQLHEKEMVLPKAQADVIRGLASRGTSAVQGLSQTNNIHIDARTDQAEVHRMVIGAVQQGNADLVDRLQRAGRI